MAVNIWNILYEMYNQNKDKQASNTSGLAVVRTRTGNKLVVVAGWLRRPYDSSCFENDVMCNSTS